MLRPSFPAIVITLVVVLICQIALLVYDYNRQLLVHNTASVESATMSGTSERKNRIIKPPVLNDDGTERVLATFVILCRNSDVDGLRQSIGQLESRFNSRYNYPYTFLNDVPFTEEFKVEMGKLTKSPLQFGLIPKEAWQIPEWIDQDKAAETRIKMKNVIYGDSYSYRLMCRFNSGFFFRHPLLKGFEYYWRVEPDVKFTTNIPYDPFAFMKNNGLVYGFTIMLTEYIETIPTLWDSTRQFMHEHEELIPEKNSLAMLQDGDKYNLCHFWSNFEIARLDFFNSKEYLAYFDYLDQAGGFFYERWGDAPVHTLGLAMFLPPEKLHFFEDIGYFHPPYGNCPRNPLMQLFAECDPKESVSRNNRCLRSYRETLFDREP